MTLTANVATIETGMETAAMIVVIGFLRKRSSRTEVSRIPVIMSLKTPLTACSM